MIYPLMKALATTPDKVRGQPVNPNGLLHIDRCGNWCSLLPVQQTWLCSPLRSRNGERVGGDERGVIIEEVETSRKKRVG